MSERGSWKQRRQRGGHLIVFFALARPCIDLARACSCSQAFRTLFFLSRIRNISISSKTQEVEPQQAADAVRSESFVCFWSPRFLHRPLDGVSKTERDPPLSHPLFLLLPLSLDSKAPSTPSSSAASWEPSGPSTRSRSPSAKRTLFSRPAGTAPLPQRSTSAPRPLAPGR